MRDPKRIKRILEKLELVWDKRPDMRLGQLIHNYTGVKYDIFYMEDDVLESALDQVIREDALADLSEEGQKLEKLIRDAGGDPTYNPLKKE